MVRTQGGSSKRARGDEGSSRAADAIDEDLAQEEMEVEDDVDEPWQDESFPSLRFGDVKQWRRFKNLREASILPTQFLDHDTLAALGISDIMSHWFEGLGLSFFFSLYKDTYALWTLEFLSSFDFVRPKDGPPEVKFRLNNRNIRRPLVDFAALFGLPWSRHLEMPEGFDYFRFWELLGGHTDHGHTFRHLHAQEIHHPVLRIFQLFLAHTIFGRTEANNTRKSELDIIASHLNSERKAPIQINIAFLFAAYLHSLGRRKKVVSIVVGGLITHIAEQWGTPRKLTRVQGGSFIDLTTLQGRSWIQAHTHGWRWVINTVPTIFLPADAPRLPVLETLSELAPEELANAPFIDYRIVDHLPQVPQQPVPARQPRRQQASTSQHPEYLDPIMAQLTAMQLQMNQSDANNQAAQYPLFYDAAHRGLVGSDDPRPTWFPWPDAGFGYGAHGSAYGGTFQGGPFYGGSGGGSGYGGGPSYGDSPGCEGYFDSD